VNLFLKIGKSSYNCKPEKSNWWR